MASHDIAANLRFMETDTVNFTAMQNKRGRGKTPEEGGIGRPRRNVAKKRRHHGRDLLPAPLIRRGDTPGRASSREPGAIATVHMAGSATGTALIGSTSMSGWIPAIGIPWKMDAAATPESRSRRQSGRHVGGIWRCMEIFRALHAGKGRFFLRNGPADQMITRQMPGCVPIFPGTSWRG